MSNPSSLSRREREVMDLLYRLGEATASQLREAMDSPPSNSAVRALLATMTTKGHITHRRDGLRYVYRPIVPADQASASALQRIVDAFFGGSRTAAAVALLGDSEDLEAGELEELEALIRQAKEAGR